MFAQISSQIVSSVFITQNFDFDLGLIAAHRSEETVRRMKKVLFNIKKRLRERSERSDQRAAMKIQQAYAIKDFFRTLLELTFTLKSAQVQNRRLAHMKGRVDQICAERADKALRRKKAQERLDAQVRFFKFCSKFC